MKRVFLIFWLLGLSFSVFSQVKVSAKEVENLNIDFMLRGYFYAQSSIKDKNALVGFGESSNQAKSINSKMKFPSNKLSLVKVASNSLLFLDLDRFK